MDSKNIPKVELHCHLEACFQRQTVNEIGQTLGLDVPEDPEVFKREWLITEPVDNLEQALKKFANIQKLWGSEEELGAERIGHGIHIIHDPAVMEFVKRNRVLLELCPTSNLLTNSVPSIRAHPLRKLMEAGVMVSINSDDPHLFGIDLCHEYEVVHNELDLTLEDFNRINDHAAACSFLPPEEKQKVWPRETSQRENVRGTHRLDVK